ncbi:5-formyltetrahydrofolate cyclo-ligase [Bacillus spongiae]|uniref:5-formyltetrahydrofolate cyclo-ligase n=1 Tax=Bacillus spongiae TaxID=2683610 RepID=A0ABU8H9J2_9BACI
MGKKQELREDLKCKLQLLKKTEYEQKSLEIARNLFQLEDWRNAQSVGLTISQFPEVDTWQIIRQAWAEEKEVLVPKCKHKKRELEFYKLTSFEQLENVYIHLFEPMPSKTVLVKKEQIELLIVPGIAFNTQGYRLGFGGGYYDRFLVDYTGRTLSLAFPEQWVSDLPVDSFDLPVQKIVTSKEVVICDTRK